MMKLLISRQYNDKETLGYGAVLDGASKIFEFSTLELPLFVVPMKINSPMIDCIPEGRYEVHKVLSPTKGRCFQIMSVPSRTSVLIHTGNYVTGKKVDSQGCILVGSKFEDINKDGNLDVVESTVTLKKLLELLPDEFTLTII